MSLGIRLGTRLSNLNEIRDLRAQIRGPPFAVKERMRRALAFATLAAVVALAACADSDRVTVIDGVPNRGTLVPVRTVVADQDVSAIGVGEGALVAGVGAGIVRSKLLGDDTLAPVPLVAGAGEPTAIGVTSWIGRRGTTGYLAFSDHGLFHDANASLVPSPFTAFVVGKHVHTLDVVGTGATESLWIASDEGAFVRRGTGAIPLSLTAGKIDAVVGIDDHRALAFGAGSAWEIDVNAGTAMRVVDEMPALAGFDHGDDGSIFLASSSGLYVRAADGMITQRTFAAAGAPARPVRAVSVGIDRVVALVDGDAVSIVDGRVDVLVSDHTASTKVAVDANGDVWLAAPRMLERLPLGKPTSFAADIAPFMTKHCQTCHATGVQNAPKHAFDDYETARAAAVEISSRLRAAARPVMPPAATEVLAPADYRVVVRWIASGTPR